jgi:hypothetical protein
MSWEPTGMLSNNYKMTLADISKAQNISSHCLDSGYTDCVNAVIETLTQFSSALDCPSSY